MGLRFVQEVWKQLEFNANYLNTLKLTEKLIQARNLTRIFNLSHTFSQKLICFLIPEILKILILILLQDTPSCCLWVGVIITNISVAAIWPNWLLYFMWSYTNLNLPLDLGDIILRFTPAVHVISMIYTRIKSIPKRSTLLHKIRVVQVLIKTKIYTNINRCNSEKSCIWLIINERNLKNKR